MRTLLYVFCVSCIFWAASAHAVTFYVAGNGDDGKDGLTAASAFASPERAVAEVAKFRMENPEYAEAVVVEIGDGMYFLKEKLWLKPEISGNPQSPTIFKAADGAKPVLSGGVALGGWTVAENGWWQTEVPEWIRAAGGGDEWRPPQLFVNGQRCLRPKMPKVGFYYVKELVPATEAVTNRCMDRFRFDTVKQEDGTEVDEIPADMANFNQVEVVAMMAWTCGRFPLDTVDSEEKIVKIKGQTCAPHTSFMQGHPYFLDNVKDALSDPGQWYYDSKTNVLTYIPKEGETPENTEVVLPVTECLMVLGYVENVKLEYVTFYGLTFRYAAWNVPEKGVHQGQGEIEVKGAIVGLNVRNCTFDSCAVLNCGGYGIEISRGSQYNTIKNCDIIDMGAGGIKIGGFWGTHPEIGIPFNLGTLGDYFGESAYVTHHNVTDCTISHLGRLLPAGIGVIIGHASYCTVENCDIYDMYYSATSLGWSWGYPEPSHAHDNRVAWNHMYLLGQGVLSDMGGVYTLGTSPGTVIEYNRIHDVDALTYGGWGLYTDEGSTGIVMRGNTVYRTKTGSFHQHYGKENIIENNILCHSRVWQVQRTRPEEHVSFRFLRNVVYWENKAAIFWMNWDGNNFELDHNLYYNPNYPVKYPESGGGAWLPEKNQDLNSLFDADPLFVDAANDDYRLKPESPAYKLGFQPIPDEPVGRRTKSVLTEGLPEPPAGFEKPYFEGGY